MVAAVDALVELATLTNDTVIEPHAERLTALLEQVRPLLGRLAERSDILATLIVDLGRFVERFPKAVHNGTALMLVWLYPDVGGLLGQGTGQDPLEALTGPPGATRGSPAACGSARERTGLDKDGTDLCIP